jgi:hypothetical protein
MKNTSLKCKHKRTLSVKRISYKLLLETEKRKRGHNNMVVSIIQSLVILREVAESIHDFACGFCDSATLHAE